MKSSSKQNDYRELVTELNLNESDDSSHLIRYLTRKGAKVDPSIKWEKNDLDRVEKCDTNSCKRELVAEANQRCGKLRRCSKMINFAPLAEMMKMPSTFDLVDKESCSTSGCATEADELLSCCEQPKSHTPITIDGGISSQSREDPLDFLAASTVIDRHNSSIFPKIFSALPRSSSFSNSRSFRWNTHTATEVTVLLIDIQGFTAECASLPAGYVGEWVAAFYSRVDKVAAAHGVQKVAVRGDCCICVAGLEGSVPFHVPRSREAPDLQHDQATRMLAFAAELHGSLATLTAGGAGGYPGGAPTATRMGMATGEATFLVNAAAGSEAAPCAGVQGFAVNAAELLEAKAAPGKVYVHRSTADRWAAEARRPTPPTALVECEGRAAERAAVYDCIARAFLAAPPAAAPEALAPLSKAPLMNQNGALRQIASASF